MTSGISFALFPVISVLEKGGQKELGDQSDGQGDGEDTSLEESGSLGKLKYDQTCASQKVSCSISFSCNLRMSQFLKHPFGVRNHPSYSMIASLGS